MNRQHWILAGGIVLASGWAASAPAQQSWYAGVNAGRADYDQSGLEDTTGYSLFAGYRFNRWFAGQVGYVNLGEFDAEAGDGSIEVDGFEGAVVGSVALSPQLSAFGKVGAYVWDADADTGGLPAGVGDDDGTDLTLGIGAEYQFPNRIGARIAWDRYNTVGDEDIDYLSAGVTIGFQ